MRTLVMMHSPAMARQLALELENLGEEWQVHWACDMPSGLEQLRSGAVEMLIVDQQMAQIPFMSHPMIKRYISLPEKFQCAGQDFSKVFVHDLALIYGHDIIKTASFMHAKR